MLFGQLQKRLEPFVLALQLLGVADILLHGKDLLFHLRVLRLKRLIAEHIVVIPLGQPVDGRNAGTDGGQDRPDHVFNGACPVCDGKRHGGADSDDERDNENGLEAARPEFFLHACASCTSRIGTPNARSIRHSGHRGRPMTEK